MGSDYSIYIAFQLSTGYPISLFDENTEKTKEKRDISKAGAPVCLSKPELWNEASVQQVSRFFNSNLEHIKFSPFWYAVLFLEKLIKIMFLSRVEWGGDLELSGQKPVKQNSDMLVQSKSCQTSALCVASSH